MRRGVLTLSLSVALVILVVGEFFPCIENHFVNYDDPPYVTANPHVQQGLTWAGVVWAFRSGETANWHPLTWFVHMSEWELFGVKPWGYHLTSVLLHGLNTVLVFLVFRRMTRAPWRSFFVAAFFGLHPLRVESVAWVAEQKDLLSAGFGLLALCQRQQRTSRTFPALSHSGSGTPTRGGQSGGPAGSSTTRPRCLAWITRQEVSLGGLFGALGLVVPIILHLP